MTTKKELLQELKQKDQVITELRNMVFQKNQKIKELEPLIEKLTQTKERILIECNSRANFIKNILKIISGYAQPISKYEVIRDMFLPQLKEKELEDKAKNNYGSVNLRSKFLSEEINERDFEIY